MASFEGFGSILGGLIGLGSTIAGASKLGRKTDLDRELKDISRSGGAGARAARQQGQNIASRALAGALTGGTRGQRAIAVRQGLRASGDIASRTAARAGAIAGQEAEQARRLLDARQRQQAQQRAKTALAIGGGASTLGAQLFSQAPRQEEPSVAQQLLSSRGPREITQPTPSQGVVQQAPVAEAARQLAAPKPTAVRSTSAPGTIPGEAGLGSTEEALQQLQDNPLSADILNKLLEEALRGRLGG